jgi:hypothetical protein
MSAPNRYAPDKSKGNKRQRNKIGLGMDKMTYPIVHLFLAMLIQGGMVYLLITNPPITPHVDPKPTAPQSRNVPLLYDGHEILTRLPRKDETQIFDN